MADAVELALVAHEFADIFPLMGASEFDALCADIKTNGLVDPAIWLFEEKILDGRHRYRACRALNLEPTLKQFRGNADKALKFVVSRNRHRRHLDESQRGLVATRLATLAQGRPELNTPIGVFTQPEAAKQMNVSVRSVQRAKVVLDHGTPELVAAVELADVEKGKISVSTAATLTELPPEEQREVVEKTKTDPKAAINAAHEVQRRSKIGALIDRGTPAFGEKLGRFAILCADPPWQHEGDGTAVDPTRRISINHYPTMPLDKIQELGEGLQKFLLPDCILFLWATATMTEEACQVMRSWGFTYKTQMVWVKDKIGMGHYVRNQHELLLVGSRGNPPHPSPANRPSSIFNAARRQQSEKPKLAYELIDQMYPELPKLELFARTERAGWVAWGNEVGNGIAA